MKRDLVVDSSVVVKWLCVETGTPDALVILQAFEKIEFDLHAPEFISAEVGNVVWKKHRLQGVTATDAHSMIDAFQELTLLLTPTSDLLDAAFRLAVTHNRTVYDMLYVALSVRLGCQFVTADERLVHAVQHAIPEVVALEQWALQYGQQARR